MGNRKEHTVALSDIPVEFAQLKCTDEGIKPLVANDEFFALMGYARTPGELYPADLLATSGWDQFSERLRVGIEAGATTMEIEVPQETPAGSILRVRTRCKYDPDRRVVSCSVLDVTSWMETRKRLRMSEDAFRVAVEMSGKIIAVFDIAEHALLLQNVSRGRLIEPIRYENVPHSLVTRGLVAPEGIDLFLGLCRDIESGVPRGTSFACASPFPARFGGIRLITRSWPTTREALFRRSSRSGT